MLPPLFFLLPVVVVDVAGDRLDPAHTRSLVAHELKMTAVAPDDPRAAEASGRVEISSSNGKLTVRYRKVDEPIERTISTPTDPARAEIDAAYLAGNLARDEASELVPGERTSESKPDAKSPPAIATRSESDEDARDLAQMRAFLSKSAEEESGARTRIAAAAFALSAVLTVPTVYLYAQGDNVSDTGEAIRGFGSGFAVGLALGGFITLGMSLDHEPLARKIDERSAHGDAPDKIIYEVEHDWAETAKRERTGRIIGGALLVGLGSILVGLATVVTFVEGPRTESPPVAPILFISGASLVLPGAAAIGLETKVESTYRAWKTVKGEPTRAAQLSFGVGSVAVTW